MAIAQTPLLAYNLWVVSTDPIWKIYASQASTPSPPPIYYFLGFFWFWLLLLPGIFKPKIFKSPKRIGLLVWAILALILAYVPWQMQRRIMFYYTIPLALLVTAVIKEHLSPWISRRLPRLATFKPILIIVLISLVSFNNFYIIYVHINYQLPGHFIEYYHPAAVSQAITWLDEHADEDSVLLSAPETGFLAGAQAMQQVFVAHTDETANYPVRLSQVEAYYNNQINLSDLEPGNLEWVFYGPYEKALGPQFQPPDNLKTAYQQDGVIIYAVDGEHK
jgi:hypothetical protein